ncbi:MAG: PVC-type heme-binding CxxCH protein [Opitutaceae bacterium]
MTLSLRPAPRVGFFRFIALVCFGLAGAASALAAPMKVLFLGDNGIHNPSVRLRDLAPAMLTRGVQLVYTEDTSAALTLENLKRYDALLIYANTTRLEPAQEKALVDYVSQGGGLVAVHCASAAFGNSDRFIELVGGRFKSHQTDTFRTRIADASHPVMQGFTGFESWDETYVHDRHNETNRTVLEYRENEPWTWVRTEGKGRVFYTAWGHDQRTWANPGFIDLMERGIRYVAGQKLPDSLAKKAAVAAFEYQDATETAKVPFYSADPAAAREGANPWPKIQKPMTPQQSMEHIIVPAGFELQLFASDPDIKKPIAMAWDERGRLWIVEAIDYPNRLLDPGQKGSDRIVICEDTNRDGKADKFTVFADGLNVPTSLTFARGGVIVHQAPVTLFLKDTDGDDKADINEVLLTPWNRSDTHAGPSNLTYGLDNWIWGVVGYSSFMGGSVGGKPVPQIRQGIYRFKSDGSAMEPIRNTNNNTWGLGFDENGTVFASTANNVPSVYMPIASRYYPPAGLNAAILGSIADTSRYLPITPKFREVDVFGGYTAAAGHAVYTARSFPKRYWNRVAFVNEPTGHLVGEFNLEPNGADFRSRNPTNLLASDDEWCAPIMAEVGPDGSVWVIDWYNYIIQHNPTPAGFKNGLGNAYDNPLRDKSHGRIYRVVWKEGTPSVQPNLHTATPGQLVAALKNDNLLWRRHAQRLLVERGYKDVVPALIELTKDQSVDEVGLNVGATHALWTLQGLNALDSYPNALAAATDALKHPSAGVRRSAVQVLPRTAATATSIASGNLLKDADAQVRLAALLALAESPNVPAVGPAIRGMLVAQTATLDRWSGDAAKMAATTQSEGFIASLSPEDKTAASNSQNDASRTLLTSSLLMTSGAGLPPGWEKVATAGEVQAIRADVSHGGHHSLLVTLKGEGAAGGASTKVKVKRNFRYELSGWVKTAGLPAAPAAPAGRAGGPGGGRGGAGLNLGGATLAVQGLGGRGGGGGGGRGGPPSIVRATSDWTQLRIPITTTNQEEITITASASLGAAASGGTSQGSAWFDDVTIREVGPTDETISDPLSAVINHVLARSDTTPKVAPVPVPAQNAVVLNLGAIPDVMKFDKAELTVKAGSPVRLIFKNNDHMPHNFLLLRPGTIEAVGAIADRFLTDPTAMARSYVPDSPDVLAFTPLVNPTETAEIAFTAPTVPGRYPYVCTFPGHWRLMQGTLIVTP